MKAPHVVEIVEFDWVCETCGIRAPHLFSNRNAAERDSSKHLTSAAHREEVRKAVTR